MDIEKLTLKVQQSINEAQLIAVKYNHQQIDVVHLFSALISQEDGLIPNILGKIGINIKLLNEETNKELDKMPKVLGEGAQSSGVYATRRFEEVFVKGEKIAKDFKDSYISVEHVMLAMMDIDKNGIVGNILKNFSITKEAFLNVLAEVRGNQRVDTQDPEGTYEALVKYGRNLIDDAKSINLIQL